MKINHGNTTTVGTTESGKTYTILSLAVKDRKGALFFNTKNDRRNKQLIRQYTKVDASYSPADIIKAMREGEKLNYLPSDSPKSTRKEVTILIDEIFKQLRHQTLHDQILILDELPALARSDKDAIEQIERTAMQGAGMGLRTVYIAQRFANMPNVCFTQSETKIVFRMDGEKNYFARYGWDYESIQSQLKSAGKHHFVIMSAGAISPPHKI